MARVNPRTELCGNGDCEKFAYCKGRCSACYWWRKNHDGLERPYELVHRVYASKRPCLDSPIDIAWFAGFYDGEGSVRLTPRPGSDRKYLAISIGSTDLDYLERCESIFGGHICVTREASENRKKTWTWALTTGEYAYAVCIAMWPLLGRRRQADVTRCIKGWIEVGVRPSRHRNAWPDSRKESLPSLAEKFWGKVDRSGECWRWADPPQKGYGKFFFVRDGKVTNGAAHRIAWELIHGQPPGRLHNECGDTTCVRPDHWFEPRMSPKARSTGWLSPKQKAALLRDIQPFRTLHYGTERGRPPEEPPSQLPGVE